MTAQMHSPKSSGLDDTNLNASHCGLKGLTDRSRRPCRQANQLPLRLEQRCTLGNVRGDWRRRVKSTARVITRVVPVETPRLDQWVPVARNV